MVFALYSFYTDIWVQFYRAYGGSGAGYGTGFSFYHFILYLIYNQMLFPDGSNTK